MWTETLNDLEKDPRNNKRYYFDTTPFRRVLTPTLRQLFKLVAKIQTRGTEHLPASGPVVLAANHLTNFDVLPMQFSISRPVFFMAKAELHQNPLFDAMIRKLGAFPVQRGQRDDWALRHAQRVLEHNQVLGIFPEGTRSKGKGLHSAKTGAARLAIAANCPIVPMALTGTDLIPKGFPRRVLVTITTGAPLFPRRGETALGLTDRLMFTLAELLPPELRGVYAERPRWLV